LFGQIGAYMADDLIAHTTAGETRYGLQEYQAELLGWAAAFPDMALYIDDVYEAPDDAARVCVRWTLMGTYTGFGPYGPPTGQRARLMGLTFFEVMLGVQPVIARLWTHYDELSLRRQINARAEAGAFYDTRPKATL
jgi:predicted ester cyclase